MELSPIYLEILCTCLFGLLTSIPPLLDSSFHQDSSVLLAQFPQDSSMLIHIEKCPSFLKSNRDEEEEER
jgi:hypothetical protein